MMIFGYPAAFLLDAAMQTAEAAAETAEHGPGTALMPMAAGLLAALALMAFFMRFAAKKGEMDRKKYKEHDFGTQQRKKP